MGDVRIGTSGWSYPSGPGTWNGIFYPSRRSQPRRLAAKADELAYYAEHFDTVEVNSSFYRLPDPAVTKQWAARTPSSFDFSLKLFQKFTHPGMFLKAAEARAGGEEGPIPAVHRRRRGRVPAVHRPARAAGKLGALLVQFPPSFRHGDDAREYLAWLLQAFSDYPVAVELRHRSWSDHQQDVLALLQARQAAWVQIDEPKFRFSIQQNHLPNLRQPLLHAAARPERGEVVDARPSRRALQLPVLARRSRRLRRHGQRAYGQLVQKIYVFMNNHFAGKAVANAAALRHAIGQPVPGEYLGRDARPLSVSGRHHVEAWRRQTVRLTRACGGSRRGGTRTAEDAEPQEG